MTVLENQMEIDREKNKLGSYYEGAKKAIAAIPKIKPYKIDMPIKAKKQYLDLNSDLPEPPVIVKEGIIESALNITDF